MRAPCQSTMVQHSGRNLLAQLLSYASVMVIFHPRGWPWHAVYVCSIAFSSEPHQTVLWLTLKLLSEPDCGVVLVLP